MRHKRGDARGDGKVFLAYLKRGSKSYERWVQPRVLEQIKQKQKAYRQSRYEAYKKAKEGVGRPSIGARHPETGLLFITVTSTGKEVWGDQEMLDTYRRRQKERTRKCSKRRYKSAPPPTVCVGDRHPTRDGLFAILVNKVRVKYGTAEELRLAREATRQKSARYRKANRQKYLDKYRAAADFLKANPHLKRSRGDLDPITGKLFWSYSSCCLERWVTPGRFEELQRKAKERRMAKSQGRLSP